MRQLGKRLHALRATEQRLGQHFARQMGVGDAVAGAALRIVNVVVQNPDLRQARERQRGSHIDQHAIGTEHIQQFLLVDEIFAVRHRQYHRIEIAQDTLSDAQSAIQPLIPYLDTLRWAFIALALAGIGLTVWARLDDWNRGRRCRAVAGTISA